MISSLRVVAAAAVVAGAVGSAVPVTAAPLGQSLAAVRPAAGATEQVYWRGRGWGWGGGAFVGGLAAGAIIGGAIAAPYYYGYPGYYPPGYYGQPAYGPPPDGGDAEAYCMQRYRSYDPNTGTFLGKDGRRHPCP